VVERALDQLISASEGAEHQSERFEALLAQLDRIADRPDAYDPLPWDERGLPT
jgi:antitoxin VapB